MSHLVVIVNDVFCYYRQHLVATGHAVIIRDRVCPEEKIQDLVEATVGTQSA